MTGSDTIGEVGRQAAPEAPRPLRILVVDDDPAMVGAITALVGLDGHQVITAYDGETALRSWRHEQPDLILLDLAMPGADGFSVAKQLRSEGAELPIIVVSGERGQAAKVRALDMGADDYVTKPFGKDELLARIRAALRRPSLASGASAATFRWGNVAIDPALHAATVAGRAVGLTPTEYRLLEALVTAGGAVVGHERLLEAAWPGEPNPDRLWLKPHLARLRRKLAGAGGPALVSVRSFGWRLEAS